MDPIDSSDPEVEVYESAVDWLTLTGATGEPARRLMGWSDRMLERRQSDGERIRMWSAQGYTGYQSDGIERGARPDGAILRLHGATAAQWWLDAYRLGLNVTRFDVQVTARDLNGDWDFAGAMYNAIDTANQTARRPIAIALTRFGGDGTMCTAGRRSAERYLRLYEKSLEEPGVWQPHTWRWEVEFKAGAAQHAAELVQSAVAGELTITAMVYTQFLEKGVRCPFLQIPLFRCTGASTV